MMPTRLTSLSTLLATFLFTTLIGPPASTGATVKTLHSFNAQRQGSSPNGGFVSDSAGNLYGATATGGKFQHGTVFKLQPNSLGGWAQTVLYDFKGEPDGTGPSGQLLLDGAGILYGTTSRGGAYGYGTVFALKQDSVGQWSEQVLHSFQGGHIVGNGDGSNPEGGLILDNNGNLFGTTQSGGTFSWGTVFELAKVNGTWTTTILYNFANGNDGVFPLGRLVIDSSGNLYGTAGGGSKQSGVVYELTPLSGGKWKQTVLHVFGVGSDGTFPENGLVADAAGNLYGTTDDGGTGRGNCDSTGCGTIFEVIKGSNGQWTESVLYNFQGTGGDGSDPETELVFDSAGNLYGTTYNGGGLGTCTDGGCGTVFELTPNGSGQWTESVLWKFTGGSDGANPSSGIFVSSSGQLLGETFSGGPSKANGTVFALASGNSQWNLSVLASFAATDGEFPSSDVVADAAGNLYGTTANGGANALGAVFELMPQAGGGWQEKVIYSFQSGHQTYFRLPSGTFPSRLVLDSAGNLYGETQTGGNQGLGTVYELSPSSGGQWTEKTLYTFGGGKNGDYPSGGLVFDAAGNLYGTTVYGGIGSQPGKPKSGHGVVFELTPSTNGKWTQSVIYRFAGYPNDGEQSQAGLIFDTAGNLYGTTLHGGTGNCLGEELTTIGCGTVFELSPAGNGSWTESVLHSFVSFTADAAFPFASLTFDKAGNLYGTTMQGLSNNQCNSCGAVFQLSPKAGGGWNENVVFVFPDPANGIYPVGSLVADDDGNLYGTASAKFGGCNLTVCGTAFELSPVAGSWTIQVLHSFTSTGDDGGAPRSGLIRLPSGKLYGTTTNGGIAGEGVVFEITP